MGFHLPSGVVNTDSVMFVADTTLRFALIKELSDQTLVMIHYGQLTPPLTLTGNQFTVDVTSNPQLVVSYPQIDPTGDILSFLLSGGIAGQQYNISVTVNPGASARTDVLTVSIPSFADCECASINPVPQLYTQVPFASNTYVNTGVRYFWGTQPPPNPNVMDQWYSSDSNTLYEYATDGVTFFWQTIASTNLVAEAPFSNLLYSRYNGYWVPDIIQSDAPADGAMYTRRMNAWYQLPQYVTEAPGGLRFGRFNGTWQVDAIQTDAPNDGNLYGRVGGTWGYAYPAGNPAGYQTAANVAQTLTGYLPLSGGAVTGDLTVNGNFLLEGLSTFTGNAVFSGSVALSNDPISPLQAANKRYVDSKPGIAGPAGPQGEPGPPGATGPQGPPGTAASVMISATAPSSPGIGALWFDSTAAQMYIWFDDGTSQQWVPVVNQFGAGGGSPPPGPPMSASLPLPDVTPHGGAIVGQTLSCSQGFWSNIPTGYAYQWRRGGANISGANATTYTLVNVDAALNVDCVVTATNSVGSNSATSNAISVAPLNPYPATGLKALYATRQFGSVTKCVRIRRASDNTQQDIGFATGNFDIASYNSFIAGTQGFVVTWYDQSGNGLDITQSNVNAQPSILLANGRVHLTFEGQILAAASSALANADQTVGMIGWSGTGSGQQIPLADFGGTGWFLLANHGAPKNPGYYCDGNTYTDATGANMMSASLMRWAVRRTGGVATVYLNGTAVKTSAAGATNAATGSTLTVGGYGTTPSWQGIISEVFVYSIAVSTTVLGQIDLSQNAYYTGLDLSTPYAGGTASVQIGASDTLSFGNVLQKDQGSPWTAFGAIQIWGQTTNAEVLFTNANAAPASTCYELWVDPLGRLRVRLINHFGNNLFLGVIGTPAASLIDGKKHVIAASYDGGTPATISNIKMYVDGVPVTASYEQTNTLGALSIVAAGQNMFVGTQIPAGPNMCGPISFFQIDKVARSAAYIANYYPGSATPLPPADANTDMRLLFTEGSGTSVHDTSANAFVGTLSSSGLWVP